MNDKGEIKRENIYNKDGIYVSEKFGYIDGVGALVSFSDNIFEKPALTPTIIPGSRAIKYKKEDKTLGIVLQGSNNNLPVEIKEKIDKNPVASACLDFLIDMTSGQGIKYGRYILDPLTGLNKFVEAQKEEEIDKFFTENNIQNLYDEAITDLEWWNKVFIEIITDKNDAGKRKIKSISHKDYVFSRLEEMNPNSGLSEFHYYSALWAEGITSEDDYDKTPMLDPKRPVIDLMNRMGFTGDNPDKEGYRYVFSIELPTPGHSYYPRAAWWSIIDSGWVEFANQIPAFKKALMTNQISLKYLIKINRTYFPDIFSREGLKTKEDQEARVKSEFKSIKDFLTGVEKTGNSMITYFKMTPDGKVTEPNIVIEAIDNKLKGGEYIDDSHEAASMIYTAFQVNPSLIGVIPGKTSTSISGSDKWALMKIQQARALRKRTKLLQILYLVKEINKWPSDIYFHIPDLYLPEDNPRQRMKPDNGTENDII